MPRHYTTTKVLVSEDPNDDISSIVDMIMNHQAMEMHSIIPILR